MEERRILTPQVVGSNPTGAASFGNTLTWSSGLRPGIANPLYREFESHRQLQFLGG
jgi:hypothetical protein